MKYQTVGFIISLCVTITFAGCKEQPWGDCGPAGLSKRVPLGVTVALKTALSPRGMITMLTTKDGANGTLICDDNQSITYGPVYRETSEIQSTETDDTFIFDDKYICDLYCHGQDPIGNARIGKMLGVWVVYAVGVSYEPLATLENYLGPDFSDCTRGKFSTSFPSTTCAIVTDKQGVTRFYPLDVDDPLWGNTQNKVIGEFSLTREEFFEWYHTNIEATEE